MPAPRACHRQPFPLSVRARFPAQPKLGGHSEQNEHQRSVHVQNEQNEHRKNIKSRKNRKSRRNRKSRKSRKSRKNRKNRKKTLAAVTPRCRENSAGIIGFIGADRSLARQVSS
jgi:hypothetical protein